MTPEEMEVEWRLVALRCEFYLAMGHAGVTPANADSVREKVVARMKDEGPPRPYWSFERQVEEIKKAMRA